MRIGIIGAGKIGGTLARLLVRAGHEVAVSNSRGPATLTDLVGELGGAARAVDVAEAARFGEVVVVAIPFGRYGDLPADALAGRVVVDATNYYPRRDGHVAELDDGTTSSSELIAAHLPGARVVKAFNTIYYIRLRDEGRTDRPVAERLAIPVAGDDGTAKAMVTAMIEQIGFAAVDAGPLAGGRRQQPDTPVYNTPVGPDEARRLLAG